MQYDPSPLALWKLSKYEDIFLINKTTKYPDLMQGVIMDKLFEIHIEVLVGIGQERYLQSLKRAFIKSM